MEGSAMPTVSTDLHDGLSAVKWRVLNALFYNDGPAGINLRALRRDQQVDNDALIEMEAVSLLRVDLGREHVELRDLSGALNAPATADVRVRRTPKGVARAVHNSANQVICVLGWKSHWTAPVSTLKGDAEADDDLLRRMAAAGLIEVDPASLASFEAFTRLPRDLRIRLSTKGRLYFPFG
jgi:hypothetical protein